MVKNVTVNDLALIELARGETAAPRAVLEQLRAKGFLKIEGGKPTLTAAGKTRAKALGPCEGNLRTMAVAANAGKCSITTAGGSSLRF